MTFRWGLFRHDPFIRANAVDRNAPMSAGCSCGWATLPVPRQYTAALLEAEQRHMDEVAAAIQAWRDDRMARHIQIPERLGAVPRGWQPLATRLHEQLAAVAPDYEVGDIRTTIDGERALRVLTDYDGVPAVKSWLDAAEVQSRQMCEDCGGPGGTGVVEGVTGVMCHGCAERRAALWCGAESI